MTKPLPTFRSTLLRLVFLPSALLVLGLAASGWLVVQQTGSASQALDDRLAQGLGAQVADQLRERVTFLDQLGGLLDATPTEQRNEVFLRLAALQNLFEGVYLLDEGFLVQEEWPTGRHQVGNDFSGQEVLRRLGVEEKTRWSDSYVSTRTGRPTVSMARVFTGGVLYADLDLEPLALLVSRLADGSDTTVSLVDAHGTYLGHPNAEMSRQRRQDQGYLAHRETAHPAPLSYQQRSGSRLEVVSVQPLAETGWAVLVSRPWAAIYQPLVPALFLLLPLLLLFVLGSFLMLFLIDRHLLGALQTLRAQTEGLGRGDYSATVVRTRYQELNAILDSFEAMRQSVWVREQDLKLGERRYRRMFEDAAIGILHTTYGGELIDANQALAHLLGYSNAEEVKAQFGGKALGLYVRPEERTAILRMLQDSPEAKVRVTTEFYHRSGRVLSMKLMMARVFDTARGEFILETFAEDVTEIRAAEEAIRQMNLELEDKVAERTRHLEKALHDLETAQAHLVHSEKMAALGQLIAGIAHELNTPLGAIQASNENISQLLRRVMAELPELQASLPAPLTQLHRRFYESAARNLEVVPSIQRRRQRKETLLALGALGHRPDDETLDSLVDLGLTTDWDQWLPLLASPQGPQSVRLTYEMVCLEKSCAVIASASEKAAKVISALRTFSHQAQESTFERVPVGQGIESVLTLFQSRLKAGVQVSTSLSTEAFVWGLEDKLGQVWTNLISNALQAMGDRGSLGVEVAVVGGEVRVTVTDTGSGIAPEIQDRIFEPFFTTKKTGEGSGLGLDICRKIIAEHHGTIGFESRPGATRFTVVLPLARA